MYDYNSGETIRIYRYSNFMDSFNINNIIFDVNNPEYANKNIDVLLGINNLFDDIDPHKIYKLSNYKEGRKTCEIDTKKYFCPIYSFRENPSLHITTEIFSPTIYGHLSRLIVNKYYKKTSIFNIEPNNNFNLVDIKNEALYRTCFTNNNELCKNIDQKVLLQISDPCYSIPKFHNNILYTNFIYENVLQAHIDLMQINYDEIWSTSEFGTNLIKDKVKSRIKVKTIRPGIISSYYWKENIKENKIENIKKDIEDFDNKTKFVSVSQDTFRNGIDVLLNSYIKTFSYEDNVILLLFVEPINEFQMKNKRLRIKYYQSLIEHYQNKYNKKKLPLLILNYSIIQQEDRSTIFHMSNCHVLTSRGEGFCLPLIESALCGNSQIVPSHTGLSEIFPQSMTKFIPTQKRNCGTKQFSAIPGELEYMGDFPEFKESPDFTPIHFSNEFHNYNEESIEWLSQELMNEHLGKNKKYNEENIPKLKKKVEELYNIDRFYQQIQENIPEVGF